MTVREQIENKDLNYSPEKNIQVNTFEIPKDYIENIEIVIGNGLPDTRNKKVKTGTLPVEHTYLKGF